MDRDLGRNVTRGRILRGILQKDGVSVPENSGYCTDDETLDPDLMSLDGTNMKETYSSGCYSTVTSMSAVSSAWQQDWPVISSTWTDLNRLQTRRRWSLLSNVVRCVGLLRALIKRNRQISSIPVKWLREPEPHTWDLWYSSAWTGLKARWSWSLLLNVVRFVCQIRLQIKRKRQTSSVPVEWLGKSYMDYYPPQVPQPTLTWTDPSRVQARRRWSRLCNVTRFVCQLRIKIKRQGCSFIEKTPIQNKSFTAWSVYSFDASASHNCAIFPPDYEFDRDTALQLLMAAGLCDEEKSARLFFLDSLSSGHFHFSRTDLVTGKALYIVKGGDTGDITQGSSCLSDVSSVACHSLIDFTSLAQLKSFEQLRILMFSQGHESRSITQVPRDFFLSMPVLHILDLSRTQLIELPNSVGNATCLRYLNLSETPIKCLPETIACLENLQTLKLRACSNLCTLPKGMSKLLNLRYLDLDVLSQLSSMPPDMGDLTELRTLSAFIVDEEEECSISQLKNLNNLSGSFCISRLENVLTEEEAMEACLSNKSELTKLEFHWSDSQGEDADSYRMVLSSLQPTSSLEELQISCYGGSQLPSWISDPAFSKLVSITLLNCENFLVLPTLGQLPSLKFLSLVDFYELEVIDHNFYGQGHIAFPALEELVVENMLSLGNWEGIRNNDFPCLRNLSVKHCPKLGSLFRLSCLRALEYLEITNCGMLAFFPHGKLPDSLKVLIIEGCPSISSALEDGGQNRLKVANIPSIWVDHQQILFD